MISRSNGYTGSLISALLLKAKVSLMQTKPYRDVDSDFRDEY